jgi:DNA processing protein
LRWFDVTVDPIEAVALSLARSGSDTRAPRLFREQILPALAGRGNPGRWLALTELLGALGFAASERRVRAADLRALAASSLDAGARAGLRPIAWYDPAYPALLREIPDPPIVLWSRGCLETLAQSPAVAVVGSRNATPEGLATARRLGRGLAEAGLAVVSGLARGIDAAAHRGALDGAGSTVAVLGNGADIIYPAGHRELAGEVVRRGALMSEFAPGTPPLPRHFPLRNRIISGFSHAVVIVEASERSGSLITARAALEQGREVLAVPGGVTSGCHRGCHALIRDGARLVETVDDVLDEIGWRSARTGGRTPSGKPQTDLGLGAKMAPGEPVDLDGLAERTGRSASELLAELGQLELGGTIARLPGGKFVRLD